MELNMREKWELIRFFTVKRMLNAFKLYSSYFLSSVTKKALVWGLPVSIAYEPTTSCNLRCPECPSGLRSFTRPTGNASIEKYQKLIDEVKSHVFHLTLYFQGEPYLNPDFFTMISCANNAKIYTVTSTNAHYLSEENCIRTVESGLNKIIVSLDGLTQESYAKYRIGGELEKVEKGVKNLVRVKRELASKSPQIIIQMIAFSHNEDQIKSVKRLKKKWGVDRVQIKTAQVYEVEENELLPKDPLLSRYKKDGEVYAQHSSLPNKCWRLWSSPVLTQDGQLIPCCFDKDADHQMGEVGNGQKFESIWRNEEYFNFRKQLLKDRSQTEICKNCSEGVKVWN